MNSSQTIKNPKTELSKKTTFNDDDLLNAALSTGKNLCNSYAASMQSASSEKLYLLLFTMFKDISQQNRKLLDLQFQHGWCSFTQATTDEIKELKGQYDESRQQFK
ncbi:spore coat protein [Sporosarcina sp. G11-34]|uniref:spore coat protein n=1 Tax=Sporosarcina sp. G11-34 TaxID=2849605 RepID=UPI0022A90DA0|nr:spore coat protein [Sporosarcina sp. G11-34]MCZ2257782.1 spore coat protein [Sporosarcina sp. G11-34]